MAIFWIAPMGFLSMKRLKHHLRIFGRYHQKRFSRTFRFSSFLFPVLNRRVRLRQS